MPRLQASRKGSAVVSTRLRHIWSAEIRPVMWVSVPPAGWPNLRRRRARKSMMAWRSASWKALSRHLGSKFPSLCTVPDALLLDSWRQQWIKGESFEASISDWLQMWSPCLASCLDSHVTLESRHKKIWIASRWLGNCCVQPVTHVATEEFCGQRSVFRRSRCGGNGKCSCVSRVTAPSKSILHCVSLIDSWTV